MPGTQLSRVASDPTGMTLAELEEAVRQARVLELPDTSPVKATTTLRGRLKSVTVQPPDPPAPPKWIQPRL